MVIVKEPLAEIDGIMCYTKDIPDNYKDYHSAGLENLYHAEKEHFWFMARRELIMDAFLRRVPLGCDVLEIGAGTGYVAEGLQQTGYRMAVGEIHLSGLRFAKEKGIAACYQFDLFDSPFKDEFDVIGLFDVMEHLSDDTHALNQVARMLKPGGKLFVTVPAHQWLWSRADSIASHKRRYSKKLLVQSVNQTDLQVLECRFIFMFIVPLLYFRHLKNKDSGRKVTRSELNAEIKINPLINKILLGLTRFESRITKWLPNIAGGSLLLVAEKKKV